MAQVNAQALRAARHFVRNVQKAGIHLDGAYLFGSYATGRAHRDSDIDVALISRDFSGWVDDFEKIRSAINEKDPRIEFVNLRPDSFVDENPLAREVKTKGISQLPNGIRRKAQSTTKPKSPRRRKAKRARRSAGTRAKSSRH